MNYYNFEIHVQSRSLKHVFAPILEFIGFFFIARTFTKKIELKYVDQYVVQYLKIFGKGFRVGAEASESILDV